MEKKKRGRGCLIALAVIGGLFLLLIIAAVALGGSDDGKGASKAGEPKTQLEEVTITACGPPDLIGVVYVAGEATNGSSERSDYIIQVAVIGPDGTQLGTGTTIASNVEPGQKAIWKSFTDTPNERWADGATCKVVNVERNASL